MRIINEAELQQRFGKILEEAERQTFVIRRDGKEIAAIVSIADYERVRAANIQSFLQLRESVAAEATTNGLTEPGLTKILNDGRA